MATRATPHIRWLILLGLVAGFLGSGALHLAFVPHCVDEADTGASLDCAVCQASHHSLGEAPAEPPPAVLPPHHRLQPLPGADPTPAADLLLAAPRAPPVLS